MNSAGHACALAFAISLASVAASDGAWGYPAPVEGRDYRELESCPNAPNDKSVCVRISQKGANARSLGERYGVSIEQIRAENREYTLALCSGGGRLTRGWGFIMPNQAEDPRYVMRMRRSNAAWETCPADHKMLALIPGSVLALPKPSKPPVAVSCPTCEACPPATPPVSNTLTRIVTVEEGVSAWVLFAITVLFILALLSSLMYRRTSLAARDRYWNDRLRSASEQAGTAATVLARQLAEQVAEAERLRAEFRLVVDELHSAITKAAPDSDLDPSRRVQILAGFIRSVLPALVLQIEQMQVALGARRAPPRDYTTVRFGLLRKRVSELHAVAMAIGGAQGSNHRS